MEQIKWKAGQLYKWKGPLERIVFPLLLFVFPFLLVNQGIDITDTTYSLGYYRFMDKMDTTWVLATYLANLFGSLLRKLPFGATLLGMNLYTGLIVSALALLCYFTLKKYLPAPAVLLGEIIALSLCWCPTTILYNYLTYFLFTAGSLLLYTGIVRDKKGYLIFAGVCLGLNVMVRFPNLTEMALILAVWFAGWLNRDKLSRVAGRTGYCILGYLAGVVSVLLLIMVKYGMGAFPAMMGSLFGMTKEASDYTPAGMVSDILSAYGVSFRWMAYMLPCVLLGVLLFLFRKGKWEKAKKLIYCLGILLLLRLYWGKGMFTLRYYDYECVFQWMMLFLILTLACCMADLCGYLTKNKEIRVLAAIILVVLLITPLGSNNYTWQNMNNLFLIAPYTVWTCFRLLRKTKNEALHFPWQAFVVTILVMVFVQGLGFSFHYVFRDGTTGEKRDYPVENSEVLRGMYTTRENAESLSELIAFCNTGMLTGTGEEEAAVFWGDAPGLSYILDIPSAIFTTWPEIPSSTLAALDEALSALTWQPPVILHNETGREIVPGDKTDLILDYLAEHHYQCVFENSNYKIYVSEEEETDDQL